VTVGVLLLLLFHRAIEEKTGSPVATGVATDPSVSSSPHPASGSPAGG